MKTRTGFRRIWPLLLLLTLPTVAVASPDPIGVRELELKVEKAQFELEKRLADLEQARNVLTGLLTVNVLGLVFAYWRWVGKADKLVQKRLGELIESRPGALTKLIDERDADQLLRRSTRVTIVSRTLELEGVLRQHGFKNLRTTDPAEDASALEQPGVVVLDLENGIDEPQAIEMINRYDLEHVLVFSYGRRELPPGRATFANSHMTLFSRLLELVKFQDAAARG